MKFYYDHKTHWATDNQNSVIATAPGSFQERAGLPRRLGSGLPALLAEDPDGDGIYTFDDHRLPAGSYEAKVPSMRAGT